MNRPDYDNAAAYRQALRQAEEWANRAAASPTVVESRTWAQLATAWAGIAQSHATLIAAGMAQEQTR